VVNLKVGDKSVAVPVHIQPGQHDQVLGLALGYGRKAAGRVANNVGVNAYALASWHNDHVQYSGLIASFTKTKTSIPLANVAGHNSMEGRQIVVEATLADYRKNPESNIHRHKIFSAWSTHKYEGYKWGMAIDLNACTGCSACMIACQSENNIHVVGKKHVLNGREMHWLRIDRYYVGEPSNPDTVFQPVPCMHCDNAPCETVCPVLATTHSDEGTNDMIYNRCVGTRYCANNCPYKVRRFNWFNYVKEIPSPQHLALNPDVIVRSRGVMEKCTFCKHKIEAVRSKTKIEGRKIRDGEVVTACQASCPTGAIIFGNMNDPESRVSKAHKEARTYQLLEELNTQPAVRYQSKIRNTHALKEQKHHGGKAGGH
jgi:Fe-S-cluster-containing dehydrogenase component